MSDGGGTVRRLVVADGDGRILASAPHADDLGEVTRGPRFTGFVELAGQHVYVVDVPPAVATAEGLLTLHVSHRVDVTEKGALLVEDPGLR
jgi:hypothetical protein